MIRFIGYLICIFVLGAVCAFLQEKGHDALAFIVAVGAPMAIYAAVMMKVFNQKSSASST